MAVKEPKKAWGNLRKRDHPAFGQPIKPCGLEIFGAGPIQSAHLAGPIPAPKIPKGLKGPGEKNMKNEKANEKANVQTWDQAIDEAEGKEYRPIFPTDDTFYPMTGKIVSDPRLIKPAPGDKWPPFYVVDIDVAIEGQRNYGKNPMPYAFSLGGSKLGKLANLCKVRGISSPGGMWIKVSKHTYDHKEYGETIGYNIFSASEPAPADPLAEVFGPDHGSEKA